ncbi:ABC transporter permease [Cellulomonas sp. PhB143]|uniref:ABC transporter permease n=1 Tax=Cellulomonas sp. PhB143 TaxID=2485186 RepID=UPI000F9D1F84|nr:ABC transporter permease [Cellulomonas sp. PhB143]ROS78551.1 teichoic acid transport system permease protein [Cellulomonas sp. PhB143]
MEDEGVPAPLDQRLSPQERDALVAEHGLTRMGVRPPLRKYVRQLWERRAFIGVLATSKSQARNQNSYLGQLWAVLNPLLNAAVYVIMFGLILQSTRGMSNGIAFIVVGTFMFRFFEQSVVAGSRSISGNVNLVRSVHFPRAVLPISQVLSELTTLVPALIVMGIIAFSSQYIPGQGPVPLDWSWILVLPAVALLWLFSTGCAFLVGRWVAITPDLKNLIPFVMRFLMYGSGVLFSITLRVGDGPFGVALEHQPVAVYLYLARAAITDEPSIPPDVTMWWWGIGWALAFLVVGFLVFWRGEERYGRD